MTAARCGEAVVPRSGFMSLRLSDVGARVARRGLHGQTAVPLSSGYPESAKKLR
jgi:hypothetical protein